jgi:hypothetical protein
MAGKDAETGPVIFVLDALDECTESDMKYLVSMLKRQFQGHKTQLGKVRFLLTSRPYDNIVSEFQELVDTFPYIRIPGEDDSETIGQEVNCVIKYRVNQLAKEKTLTAEIKDYLEQQLLKIPHRTYLWVYLMFDFLKSQDFKKTKGIESPITSLPESVTQAYERILSKSKDHKMVRKTLCIVLAANRPLTLAETNVAMNTEISSRSVEDLDLEAEDDFKERLRSECELFISIYHKKVYFLHQTAREFLIPELSSPETILAPLHWHGSISIHKAQSVLAEICSVYLTFLNSKDAILSTANGKKNEYIGNYIFVDYSAKNWATHFREARISNDEAIIRAILKICNPDSKSYSVWFKNFGRAQICLRLSILAQL